MLHFFDLHPQDIEPNSVSNICNFQVFSEVYLGEEPNILLFRELFYLNRQNECASGQSLELGGVSIQRRRDVIFPYANPPSQKTGIKHGFTAKTPLRLVKTLCPAFVLFVLGPTIICLTR